MWGDGDGAWGPHPGSDTDLRLPGWQAALCQPRSASRVFEAAVKEKAELFPVISFLPKTSCPWPAPHKNQLEVSWLEAPELLTLQQQVGEDSMRAARWGCAPGRARGSLSKGLCRAHEPWRAAAALPARRALRVFVAWTNMLRVRALSSALLPVLPCRALLLHGLED